MHSRERMGGHHQQHHRLTDMEELIRLGAYRAGSSPEVDEAVALMPDLTAFLGQGKEEATSIGEGYARLAAIVGGG